MNAEAVRKLRDHLRDNVQPENFYMAEWFCGTAACIAGHAVLLNGCRRIVGSSLSVQAKNGRRVDIVAQAVRILGIKRSAAWDLFVASDWPAEYQQRVNAASDADVNAAELQEAINLLSSMLEIDPTTGKERGVWWAS